MWVNIWRSDPQLRGVILVELFQGGVLKIASWIEDALNFQQLPPTYMRCSFVVACEGMAVADLQDSAEAYASDNSFTFIRLLLLSFSLFVFWQQEHVCYKYSTLTSISAGMPLKYCFMWLCRCSGGNIPIAVLSVDDAHVFWSPITNCGGFGSCFSPSIFLLIKGLAWIDTSYGNGLLKTNVLDQEKCNLGPFTMAEVCTFVCAYIIQVPIHVVHAAVVLHLADHLNIYSKRACSLLVWSSISSYF